MKNIHKGIFIGFEGVDGCGKSTQSRLLYNYLKDCNEDVILTHEPGGTDISEQIRAIVKDNNNKNLSNLTELLLMNASRAQHVFEVVRPALERGAIVICDRFNLSTFAYQGYGRGMDLKLIKKLNKLVLNGLKPDVTFFFDLDPELAFKRKGGAENNRFEKSGEFFFKRVYQGFKKLAAADKTIISVDANRQVEEIQADIINYLTKLNVITKEFLIDEASKEKDGIK